MPLRGELSRSTADNLVQLVHSIRPEWQTAGTRAGITAALNRHQTFTLADLTYAAVSAALEPANRTPAVIGLDGTHWPKPRPQNKPTKACPDCAGAHPTDQPCVPRTHLDPDATNRGLAELRRIHATRTAFNCKHGVAYHRCRDCSQEKRAERIEDQGDELDLDEGDRMTDHRPKPTEEDDRGNA